MRPVTRDLADLRLAAEAAARDDDWSTLLGYADRLRAEDPDWWPHAWAPLVALARRETGGDPVPVLREAIAGGFRQPEMFELAERFGDLPEWSELAVGMAQPAEPPDVEILRWPTVAYGPALVLDRLPPDRESELRDRLPEPRGGAWETARALLEWATTRWDHANDHVDSRDAIDVLDRAAAGERFACVEYSVLLSQSLNACAIPSRRVSLLMRDQHVGFGRGHVVSEAWIDDLGRWVVLDGQNGGWWGTDDEPLGLLELRALHRADGRRPPMRLTARTVTEAEQARWFRYFAGAISSGLYATDTVVPLLQGEAEVARLVVPADAVTHPDLSQVETGLCDAGGPALLFTPRHPFASGVRVGETVLREGEAFELDPLPAGVHDLDVRTRTSYGELAAQPLRIVRR